MAAPLLSVVSPSSNGRVLSIQSHTVQGYVGNKSAVFPLQVMGFDVDPINSVQLSNHTGYPVFKGQILNGDELWTLIEGLEANNLLFYTHLLTGYIGSLSFLEMILKVVDKLRLVNPNLIYVCDPVMGDEGRFYVSPELVPIFRDRVVPVASMLTPNHFEAEKLCGCRIDTEEEALQACQILHAAGPSKTPSKIVKCSIFNPLSLLLKEDCMVVITSMELDDKLLIIGSHAKEDGTLEQFRISVSKIPEYFTGTGDLMSALLLGWSYKYSDDLAKATEIAVSTLQAILQQTINDYKAVGVKPSTKQLELRLIQGQGAIRSPQVLYTAYRYT